MLANRGSPSRALRNVITMLQRVSAAAPRHRRNSSWSGAGQQQQWEEKASRVSADRTEADEMASGQVSRHGVLGKDAPMREFKKLYGLIKIRSRREGSGAVLLEGDVHGPPTPGGKLDEQG